MRRRGRACWRACEQLGVARTATRGSARSCCRHAADVVRDARRRVVLAHVASAACAFVALAELTGQAARVAGRAGAWRRRSRASRSSRHPGVRLARVRDRPAPRNAVARAIGFGAVIALPRRALGRVQRSALGPVVRYRLHGLVTIRIHAGSPSARHFSWNTCRISCGRSCAKAPDSARPGRSPSRGKWGSRSPGPVRRLLLALFVWRPAAW